MKTRTDPRWRALEDRRGWALSRVSPEAQGVPWNDWMAMQCAEWRAEADAMRAKGGEPSQWRPGHLSQTSQTRVSEMPIRTKRDGYGWRDLPTGSGLLEPKRSRTA